MNARTIIAADGLPRRAFTVRDVERMVEVGLIGEDERIELIEGELIPMSPKGIRHEVIKTALLERWYRIAEPFVRLVPETTFQLSIDTYLEPDVCLYPRAGGLRSLDGGTALLGVEIAASSLGYDLGRKAAVYASFGVRELWVVDARAGGSRAPRAPGGWLRRSDPPGRRRSHRSRVRPRGLRPPPRGHRPRTGCRRGGLTAGESLQVNIAR